jgi:hypothetical protein
VRGERDREGERERDRERGREGGREREVQKMFAICEIAVGHKVGSDVTCKRRAKEGKVFGSCRPFDLSQLFGLAPG